MKIARHGQAKVLAPNGCLVIQVEAQTVPEQQSLVAFVRNGLVNLKPNSVSQVIVRGRVAGQSSTSWQESFNLVSQPKEAASQSSIEVVAPSPVVKRVSTSYIPVKPASPQLGAFAGFIRTRNAERMGLVLGTAVLTSACWLGAGALGSGSNRSASITPTDNPISTKTAPTSSQGTQQEPNSHSIKGSFQLVDSDLGGTSDDCYGTGGYDDIEAGMPVTIRDGQGAILATGTVGTGSQPSNSEYSNVVCVFDFQVENVPKADFYAISIGRRGELNYSFAEMEQKEWTVSLSIGT